ncbi:response regulator [Patulibacter medicamentivorans]|uniref:Response regulator n=1 Tax=Patulibacter medicamentivorans TaxID=1097667 RepID=H0E755_9ACTN|nr:response regulator [Patulibacter medicamentivorans]EHN10489.1 response regulator [Patulibacter medicamentivorans]
MTLHPDRSTATPAAERFGLATSTVMVVEDHDFQRRTMLQILANLGAGALLEAADGEGALALVAEGSVPDVVLCDLDMPGLDGVAFLRELVARGIDAEVVIVSGLEGPRLAAAERDARAAGVRLRGTIGKPLTARRLLAVLQ